MKKTVLVMALLAATAAHAGFVLESGPVPIAAPQPAHGAMGVTSITSSTTEAEPDGRRPIDLGLMKGLKPGEKILVEHKGAAPYDLPAITGFGSGMPLHEAMRQILPTGWRIYSNGEVDLTQNVSWRGGRSWTAILNGVLNSANMSALINWQRLEITFSPMSAFEEVGGASGMTQLFEPAAANMIFDLTPGKTLLENLQGWSAKTGWRLVWSAPVDFPVFKARTYTGDFGSQFGPVAQALRDHATAGAGLRAKFKGGNVIEICADDGAGC